MLCFAKLTDEHYNKKTLFKFYVLWSTSLNESYLLGSGLQWRQIH